MNNNDYLFVRLWGSHMGSYGSYISNEVAKAKRAGAEFDAIFERDGEWALLRDMQNTALRDRLINMWQDRTNELYPRELLVHRKSIASKVTYCQSGQDTVIRGAVDGFGNFAGYSHLTLDELIFRLTDDRGITVRGGNDHYVIDFTNGEYMFFDGDQSYPIVQLIIDGHMIRLEKLAAKRREWLLNPVA